MKNEHQRLISKCAVRKRQENMLKKNQFIHNTNSKFLFSRISVQFSYTNFIERFFKRKNLLIKRMKIFQSMGCYLSN